MSNADKISELVSAFGADVKAKLAGPGQAEANLRKPLENLLVEAADVLGLTATFFDEVSDQVRGVRPDYAFEVGGAITGYVEVKAPGHTLEPSSFQGHDLKQWERQRDLPNLLYTNGTEFRLYRDGDLLLEPVFLTGGHLEKIGAGLTASNDFELLLSHLFKWKPAAITSLSRLITAVAPLTRLLREAVLEQLEIEAEPGKTEAEQPFSGLARDWRTLLFPEASDSKFADGYAQTVSFALLLARVEDIDLETVSLHEVGNLLGNRHSLMGRALQLLTDQIAGDFKVSLDLLVRVIGAVKWDRIQQSARDEYPYLYEKFLEVYDPELRKESGSYYTPVPVVDEMTRLTEEALQTRLGKDSGFADSQVYTVDPAMGTGTYLQSIIERTSAWAKETKGPEGHKGELRSLAKRLVGFEIQTGPYAVAEMRLTELLKSDADDDAMPPLRLYVADTLDDPHAPEQVFPSSYLPISASRRAAAKVKRDENITVVIGNPPYGEQAEGQGGWIESGSQGGSHDAVPLDDFRAVGNGLNEYVLKNLYIYFWRWATWKAFDSIPSDRSGVVCLITTSGYLRGSGFKGMREYLRRTCSEGWIINVSPEGLQPPVNTRLFRGVQQTLAIAIFLRGPETNSDEPAQIRYREISGRQAEKYEALQEIGLDDDGWRETRTDWQAPFTPAAESDWDEFPAISDLMPWTAAGVKANRTWVYSPSRSLLKKRWDLVVAEKDEEEKAKLFKESRDANLTKVKKPLAGAPSNQFEGPFKDETGDFQEPARTYYRAFDRQLVIPDSRLLHGPSPDLWAARVPGQLFVIEQHSKILADGPGLLFTNLIPDQDAFVAPGGGGSRALPLLHPDGSANFAPELIEALSEKLDLDLEPIDLLAYVAGVVGHPAFVETFLDELNTPGMRVPITADPELFGEAVEVGKRILWLHSFGEADFLSPSNIDLEYPVGDERRPQVLGDISSLPEDDEEYDADENSLKIGNGRIGGISEEVANYQVGGRKVIHSWVGYRKKVRSGRKTSPLDYLSPDSWPTEWTNELLLLLTVLRRLTEEHQTQEELLTRILSEPLISKNDLLSTGVQWPDSRDDRKARYPAPAEEEMFGTLE